MVNEGTLANMAQAIDGARATPPRDTAQPQNAPQELVSEPMADASDPAPEAGRVIVNPISGERIVIRVSGKETDGQLLVFDLYLPPGGHVPAQHVHPSQEESFTVLSGRMRFRMGPLGLRAILAAPGDSVRIKPGTAHWFGNPGAQMSHARVEVRPALRMQELFEMTEAIGGDNSGQPGQRQRISDLARVVLEFQREIAVPNAPAFLVRIFLTPLAWIGRRRASRADATGSAL